MNTPNSGSRALGLVLGAALLATGLLAGFFYAYAVSVMPGLGRADDRAFVDSMQQINEVTPNPLFFLSFFGAPLLCLAAAILARRSRSQGTRWIVAGLVLSFLAFAVTVAFNIPLNNELKDAGDTDQIRDLAAVVDDLEDPWVAWNIVRTLAATAALACLGRALVLYGRAAVPAQVEVTARELREGDSQPAGALVESR
jgi:uncharacterized membrane protein